MIAPIRTIIVDDEPLARRGIGTRLGLAGGFVVIQECTGGREAIAAIRDLAPDLVFLDVQMPEVDGFAVVRAIGADRMPTVVFVTAHDQHALAAFDAQALDYLLKPIDDDRFTRMVARIRGRVPGRGARILIRDRGRVTFLDPAELDWIEAKGDYARLHAGRRTYLLRETMAAFERSLDPAQFARIHRSTIVALAKVTGLRATAPREWEVQLRDGTRLKLSRSHREVFEQRLGANR